MFYCKTCQKTYDDNNFYVSFDSKTYPLGKLDECKKCCTLEVDNFNPDTFVPILQKIDIPYMPDEWMTLARRYCVDPEKTTGTTVLGRYISKMRLKKWRDFRFKDSEYLQKIEDSRMEQSLRASGYNAQEINQFIQQKKEQQQERPEIVFPTPKNTNSVNKEAYQQALAQVQAMLRDQQAQDGSSETASPTSAAPSLYDEYFKDELTEEDKKYLFLKWGEYRPEEWVKLEQLWEEFIHSYDIQSAGHLDTLKLICKTSLKANQLVDLNDIEGYQKMSKVYDSLMRSGKFTADQNKSQNNNFVDSIGELVAMCEEQGYIERFYVDKPNDKVDFVLQDTKNYLRSLVMEEPNLGALIETAIKQIQEEKAAEQEILDDSIDDDEDLLEEDYITEEDFSEFNEFIEEEQEIDSNYDEER